MIAQIKVSTARGVISAPTSKSMAHRLLISAAMSDGKSRIFGINPCDDVLATVECLRHLGVSITVDDGCYTVIGRDMRCAAPTAPLYCNESGSTLRFLIPIAALSGAKVTFGGTEKLISRPLSVYEDIFKERDLLLAKYSNFVMIEGPLPDGEYKLRGDVSSQFIT